MQVETMALDALIPYARNPRRNDNAVDAVAASIKEFGFRQPIVVDEDMVILVGHTRAKAAKKLGMAQVPVHIATGLTETQKKAYRIADNRLNEIAEWDDELLALELEDLRMDDFDLGTDALGFDDGEIDGLLASLDSTPEGNTDPDEVPEPPAAPVTRPGDVWLLGRHRLMCGDSTDAECVERLMAGEKADLCFTSPPYGNQRDYTTGGIADWDNLMQGVFSCLPMSESGQLLVNLGLIHRENEWNPYWDNWIQWMRDQGWRRFGWYVWDQGPGLPGDWSGRLAPAFEFVFHFNKLTRKPNKTKEKLPDSIQYNDHGNGMRRKDGSMSGVSSPESSLQTHKIPDAVLRIMRHKARGIEMAHPAVFPVALPAEIQEIYSNAGEIMYEPFSGSGTTIIAAEQTGRRCYAMELSPQYVDVAVNRWEQFTGKKATLEETGAPFDAAQSIATAARSTGDTG